MNKQEDFLTKALQTAATIVSDVDDRYRDAAFPMILQAIINSTGTITNHDQQPQTDHAKNIADTKLAPNVSVNEFFRKVKPETHIGRFVCAAYYLFHTGKAEHFTQADIIEIYGKLRIPKPKNPADVINQCIRKVHIIDGPAMPDKQKTWVITSDGEKYVEELLNDNTTGNNASS